MVSHCIVLYHTVLHCITLHSTVPCCETCAVSAAHSPSRQLPKPAAPRPGLAEHRQRSPSFLPPSPWRQPHPPSPLCAPTTHAAALFQKGSHVVGSERERSRHTQQSWFRKGPKSWGVREREADKQPWFRKGPKSWGVREREADTRSACSLILIPEPCHAHLQNPGAFGEAGIDQWFECQTHYRHS